MKFNKDLMDILGIIVVGACLLAFFWLLSYGFEGPAGDYRGDYQTEGVME